MESSSNLSSGSNLSQFDNFESTSASVAGSRGLKIDKSNRPYSDGFVFHGKTAFHLASKCSTHDGILQSFDPLVYGENKKMDCFDKELDDSYSDDSYPDGGSGLSCEIRSPILKANSDNGLNCLIEVANSNLDVSFHSSSSVGSLIDFTDHSPQDSGATSTTMMGSSVSVDTLTNELSEGLKLTEQQNEKLDEKRLSVSSSCFDPLMQDNTDARHSMSILSRGISTLDAVMGRAFASSEQGSKSKNVSGTPPKISVSNGVHTKGKGISLGVPNGKVQQSSLLRSEMDTAAGSGDIGNLVSFISVIPGLTSKPTNRSVSAMAASVGAMAEASPSSSKVGYLFVGARFELNCQKNSQHKTVILSSRFALHCFSCFRRMKTRRLTNMINVNRDFFIRFVSESQEVINYLFVFLIYILQLITNYILCDNRVI